MERPQTRYVDVGGAEVAYQVAGQGPPDVVYVPGFSHVDLIWEDLQYATFLERLASFGRLILFDRRGTGASDAVPDNAMPTWEEWADDVRAVLDAAGSKRAVVLAEADGGPAGLLFTATHPERVTGLILANTTARRLRADDYPIGIAPEAVDHVIETYRATWGTPDRLPMTFPSRVNDLEFGQWLAKVSRAAATPRRAAAQVRYMIESLDARHALPLIRVPTLVLHTRDNSVYSIEEASRGSGSADGRNCIQTNCRRYPRDRHRLCPISFHPVLSPRLPGAPRRVHPEDRRRHCDPNQLGVRSGAASAGLLAHLGRAED
jgi:pimeloyl-ACP methyl ester carboxylesterase